jgi:hypothetical protein
LETHALTKRFGDRLVVNNIDLQVAPGSVYGLLGRNSADNSTTGSTLPDSKALEAVHQAQQRRGLLPHEHYLDSGYASAELTTGSLTRYGVALITPVLLDTSRQAKAKEGFAADDFTVDFKAQQATCPAGKTSAPWNPVIQEGIPKTVVCFAAADCIPSPFKQQCTTRRATAVNSPSTHGR